MNPRSVEWLRSFLKLDARADRDSVPPSDILRQEQTVLRALESLDQQPGAMLADEVGMGKTFEALGVVAATRHSKPESRVVVLTPGPDLNTKWLAEFARFSDREAPIFDFGNAVTGARTLQEFAEAVQTHRLIVAPVTIFNSTRGARDQEYLLALFVRFHEIHGHTANAILRRFREGHLDRIDVRHEHFLDTFPFSKIEPMLPGVFRSLGEDERSLGLLELFEKHGVDGFEDETVVRRAIDLARFRLLRKLLPVFDLLIVDEAHKLKNAATVRSQAITTVFRERFRRALFLTATPFQLDISELRQVFALFSLAKDAPADLMDRADELLTDVRRYQAAYEAFQLAWSRVDAACAEEFRQLLERDPRLSCPIEDPSLRLIAERVREVRRLKDERIQPGFREWMIRSLRPDKREYRRHTRKVVVPKGERALPFLLYERFIAELFRQHESTHKAAVEINLVSSFSAARRGAMLGDGARALPDGAEEYRLLLRRVMRKLKTSRDHPKLSMVLEDALKAAENGEKTLVFCARVQTLSELSHEIRAAWLDRVLEKWRGVYPKAKRDEIFDEVADGERSKGRHSLLQARFHRGQEPMYLALRESYLHTLVPMGEWATANLDAIVSKANEKLGIVRVGRTSAQRPDYRVIKRCVEQAATELAHEISTIPASVRTDAVRVVMDARYLALGLDLKHDELEEGEAGVERPQWQITPDQALLVLGRGNGLWSRLGPELGTLPFDTRVRVVEQLARFLTFKEVTFLADLLMAAKQHGLSVDPVEAQPMLEYCDSFWDTADGAKWLERLRAFLCYFVSRGVDQRSHILEGAIKTGDIVRQTREGESRERLREAFNTPLYPVILIANEVMQEGLDLHKQCRRIIHHDLAWNPAQLEQRVGRIDRLGSRTLMLREKDPREMLDILYPIIERTIDRRIYRTVKRREKWLEFLLGAPPRFSEYELGEQEAPDLPALLAESLAIDLRPVPILSDASV